MRLSTGGAPRTSFVASPRTSFVDSPIISGGAQGFSLPNVGNYKATEDWWFFLPAILFVDTFLIFLVRFFPQIFGQPINDWYDQFGLAAVLSDVSIIGFSFEGWLLPLASTAAIKSLRAGMSKLWFCGT